MSEAQKALDRLAFNYGLDALDGQPDEKVEQDIAAMQEVLSNQLDSQELEKVMTCISAEIMKLDLHYGAQKKTGRQQILYSARDKLLQQQKLIGGIKNGNE